MVAEIKDNEDASVDGRELFRMMAVRLMATKIFIVLLARGKVHGKQPVWKWLRSWVFL
jgi:hypothetical protein